LGQNAGSRCFRAFSQHVQVVVEVGGITEDPEGTHADQLFFAAAAAERPNAEHFGPPSRWVETLP
jgi:hypothetical protein